MLFVHIPMYHRASKLECSDGRDSEVAKMFAECSLKEIGEIGDTMRIMHDLKLTSMEANYQCQLHHIPFHERNLQYHDNGHLRLLQTRHSSGREALTSASGGYKSRLRD